MIRVFIALVFLVVGVIVLSAYAGTPHGGPTTVCGPITILSHTYTVNADCRMVSIGEIVAGILLCLLSVITLLTIRPRS